MAKTNEKLSKEVPIIDSTQAFVSKYIPPSDQPHRMTFQENIRKMKPSTPTGK
jgi:hypothetical protein